MGSVSACLAQVWRFRTLEMFSPIAFARAVAADDQVFCSDLRSCFTVRPSR